ncbi:MAG: hypothetical protein ACI9NQ_000749 [Paracoccaceae bacterium]|jgi:hypothetical protein
MFPSKNPKLYFKMKMKNLMKLVGAMVLASAPLSASGKDQVLQVVYEVFSLSQSEAAASQREALTDREAYARMVAGLEGGKVKQEKLQAIRTLSGQRATSEHVRELIYATEYEPPELPNSVGVSVNSPAVLKEKPTGNEVIDALKTGPGWSQGAFPATPSIGTAFDTIPLGDSLEVEVMAGNGDPAELSIRLAVSHIKLAGYEAWGQGLSEAKMPRFAVKRVRSGLTVQSGVPTLIGTISPSPEEQVKKGEERVWFAFVTATVVEVKE